jgi:GNAT superfamily N-acetyltransferase
MSRMGATKGLESHIHQLRLSEFNHALGQQWIARGNEHAGAFELGCWSGGYPEEELEAIAALYEVMNQQPRDQLTVDDVHVTPAQLRQMEHYARANGSEQWTMYVRDQASSTLAGFTEVRWNPQRPEIVQQGNTGVFPVYRNKGLGRWLKAAMVHKIVREHPEIRFIRTSNADSNGAMVKINEELGFKPYMATCLWQVETEQAGNYLARNGASPMDTALSSVIF